MAKDDWKEIEDYNQDCSDSNGWCGFCWRCAEHVQDLHRRDRWEEEENGY